MRKAAAIVAILALLTPSPAAAWGFETHKFIVSRAIDILPVAIRPFFQANRVFIVEHAVDPDRWRNAGFVDEPPRHFVDIDAYGKYPFTELPRDYDAALAKFGLATLTKNGVLPWRAQEMADKLGTSFQDQQKGTDTLLESYQNVDAVLVADKEAIGDGAAYDARYYDAFFAKVKPILEKRLGQAISGLASVITSEWERAGRPALPVNPPPRPPAPRRRATP